MSVWTKIKYFLQGKRRKVKQVPIYNYPDHKEKVKFKVGRVDTKIQMKDGNVYNGPYMFGYLFITHYSSPSGEDIKNAVVHVRKANPEYFANMLMTANADSVPPYNSRPYNNHPEYNTQTVVCNGTLAVRKDDIKEVKLLFDDDYEREFEISVTEEKLVGYSDEVYYE